MWSPDYPDTSHFEEPNGSTPLPIAIADQQAIRVEDSVDLGQIAQRLHHERLIWMRRGAQNVNATRVQFDHKRCVVRDQSAWRPDLRQ